jgi:hypothetical protein
VACSNSILPVTIVGSFDKLTFPGGVVKVFSPASRYHAGNYQNWQVEFFRANGAMRTAKM